MKKYLYGLMAVGAVSGALLLGVGTASADTIVTPASGSDLTTLNADFNQDLIEWQVELAGWSVMVNNGYLVDSPTYQAAMSSDLTSISTELSLYSEDYAALGQ